MSNGYFVFEGYDYSFSKGQAAFRYKIFAQGRNYHFRETLSFPPVKNLNSTREIIAKRVLDNLLLMLGISYWKTYCPRRIEIKPFSLSPAQAEFWNKVYTKGLGEFFYKNKINFRGLVRFPSYETRSRKLSYETRSRKFRNRSLLMLGGGKDSIVAGELLKKRKKRFALYTLNPVPLHKKVGKLLGGEIISLQRTLDPKLMRLNARWAYNGHVPVSAIYGFTGLLAAALHGYKYVVAANEKSANYGNIKYLGQTVNHQWSKSVEFEKLFREYVREFITPDITYYSLLRSYNELKIAQMFSKYPQYFSVFSSCNTNFRLRQKFQVASGRLLDGTFDNGTKKWCGKCPKCAFVFAALAAFLPKNEVLIIFGKNMLADEKLIPVYKELLGIKGHKPFECVGTPEETRRAFALIRKRGEFDRDPVIRTIEA